MLNKRIRNCSVCGEPIRWNDSYHDLQTGKYMHVLCLRIVEYVKANPNVVKKILDCSEEKEEHNG